MVLTKLNMKFLIHWICLYFAKINTQFAYISIKKIISLVQVLLVIILIKISLGKNIST